MAMTDDNRETAVAFVVARLSSSRLPEKQLRPIGGKATLVRIIDALAEASEIDRVVLATVDEPDNQPLQLLATQHRWELFWYQGEVDDVVGRLRQAADKYQADICLLISADCPLVHGPSIDQMVRQFRAQPAADYLVTPPDANGNVCLLEGVQVARRRAWQRADEMSEHPGQREHQFPVITRNPDRFRRAEARLDGAVYGSRHRLSVDTWADLDFMQTLHQHLASARLPFRLPEVVRLLEEKPELKQINGHVYQRQLIDSFYQVLFVVDAGGPYGYGHFMRCRELAGQLVERLSWPVTFLLDDECAAQMAEACGFRVLWGALGRSVRAADSHHGSLPPHEAAASHGLVVVDVSVQRELARGWRKSLTSDQPVVVVDREDAMAAEVDLILYPGVTGRAGSDRAGLPPVIEGLEHVILRREVQRYQDVGLHKDIDLLVYLHDDAQKKRVQSLADEHGWRIAMPLGFSDEFPDLLARSRVYLSGFGQSFYEALAVGTYPVAWPSSPSHRADARAFYRAAGLSESLVEDVGAIALVVGPLLNNPACRVRPLKDGTPAVVRHLAAIREAWG